MPEVLKKLKERILGILKRKKSKRVCKACGFSEEAPFISGSWADRDLCENCYKKNEEDDRRKFDGTE